MDAVTRFDLDAVRLDYHVLDAIDHCFPGIRLICNQEYAATAEALPEVEHVRPRGIAAVLHRIPLAGRLSFAMQVLRQADRHTAIVCFGGSQFEKIIGLLNYFLPIRRRKIVICGPFVQTSSMLKKALIRRMVQGSTVCVTWSALSVKKLSAYLDLPEDKFVFVPYKANHSREPAIDMPIGNYVFSGGNGRRDYRTLVEAVRGTGIPTIISTTDSKTVEGLEMPPNVILLAAREPAFARLMAGSRLVVFPIERGTVRGGAAANILNAMWHYKPVIAAEDIQAPEYIKDGLTGYAVLPGDASALRERIVELWNAPRVQVEEMGQRAHEHVAKNFTHELFLRRIRCLAAIVAAT
jgi:hypothetical protein